MDLKIKNQDSFDLTHIFECGQCFRWERIDENTYIGIVLNRVIKVIKEKDEIIFKSSMEDGLDSFIEDYFDLKTNYNIIKKDLSQIDDYLKNSTEFGSGIRILHQDLWECIISFIISANNNIPRIKKIIERISKEYGNKIIFEGKEYYSFPTPEQLSKATISDLRNLGLGFRDKRVYKTTQMILQKEIDINKLKEIDDSSYIREELLKLDGVGEKVADCIMLFSLRRFDVFPIDVWVRRVMNDLYIHNENEEKVSKKELQKLAQAKFLGIPGLAQQYLFYWRREQGN